MSSNCVPFNGVIAPPVRTLVYLDMANRPAVGEITGQSRQEQEEEQASRRRAEVELTQEEFAKRILLERTDAVEQAELRLRNEFEQKFEAERAAIGAAVSAFATQRESYFARAEAEIVQLALAIAAKILHREAQVDPMLVATLVRMAVEKLREGSSVNLRVGAGQGSRWQRYFAVEGKGACVQVIEDAELSDHDCLVETELGTANFGLDTQLKEVEQGFFDLMALRPVKG
ncbi:MAG TPA: FliH/SctL family protein [Acidobacteriaceae bacterium]|nr:FliH/SctL family protein [Acidobacteriaceae bacterium]